MLTKHGVLTESFKADMFRKAFKENDIIVLKDEEFESDKVLFTVVAELNTVHLISTAVQKAYSKRKKKELKN